MHVSPPLSSFPRRQTISQLKVSPGIPPPPPALYRAARTKYSSRPEEPPRLRARQEPAEVRGTEAWREGGGFGKGVQGVPEERRLEAEGREPVEDGRPQGPLVVGATRLFRMARPRFAS